MRGVGEELTHPVLAVTRGALGSFQRVEHLIERRSYASLLSRRCVGRVGLTWHNPKSSVLVEGPELVIRPVAIRRLPATDAQAGGRAGDLR